MDNGLQANTVSARDPSSSAAPAPPVKRRPGRPKGSGKKHLSTPNALEKIKRPVGRPRKDGLPAGSVGPRRSTTRKAAVEKGGAPSASAGPAGMSFAGAFYPQHPGIAGGWQGFTPLGASASASAPPAGISAFSVVPQVDPSLNRDEWAVLARTKPNVFLQSLCATLAAPNPLPTVGPTVEDAFKSHLASLSPPAAKDGNMNPNGAPPLPPLYSVLKTFWLPSSPAYLSLITPGHTAKLLSEHRFLYWDPLPLVFNGIPCPACNAPLINKGRIRTGPLKVYDLERPFFIIGCEYACRSAACVAATSSPEGRRFASVDKSIMQALPTRLKDELPARLLQNDGDMGSGVDVWGWHALGVSKQLWNMVKGCLRAGMGRDAILGVIASVQNPLPEEKQEEEEDAEGESLAASGSGGGGGGVVGNGNGVEVHGNGNGSGAAEGHGASEDATMDAAPGADGGAQPQVRASDLLAAYFAA
ncbi:hypothetical protein CONPUDRAFT_88180 [Coniophora puteana RWD-64-598 SS2]|uniref:Uncharacterized protein n=1 Tax=Coniophora puteana (strain RWD-64-598) TaxID=741705 RepID=A0A5M3MX14_CONPW|nr:uncharacterized protein CONPUDRAFT_88180 [Coniophora puteana RWD-64-598 SS2]EIW83683.1 hypothetical protein CONPUDRAFT_88180 [Coniophora puteana RWD-64-598 SS2]